MKARSANEEEDLVENLNHLDQWREDVISAILEKRFKGQKPYTSLGNIMVAANPFEWLDLYDDELALAYVEQGRRDLPAHIYKTTAAAYRALLDGRGDQSILISGVSGAGKTETSKLLLGHLASVAGSDEGEAGSERIQRMVECTVVLETFGNAVMFGNNNSSRYGVVTELQFDDRDIPSLVGSLNMTYLLEKSRVVSRSASERNFHVFYQMAASDDEEFKSVLKLGGMAPNDFKYLRTVAPAEDQDLTGLVDVRDALQQLGVSELEELDVFKTLSGLLHLGQVAFAADAGRDDDASKLDAGGEEAIATAADLLGLDPQELSSALLTRPLMVRGEKFVKPNKANEATAARDGLAKDVYLGVFNFLLQKINDATSSGEDRTPGRTISLIDIFGFESFASNGFEQLLINYASEKLQQMFIQDVFKSVEKLCIAEGIDWDEVTYRDNSAVLETLEGPRGILMMLEEQCLLPHGDDTGFVALVESQTQTQSGSQVQARTRLGEFLVHHYNQSVTYTASGFVERNRDKLHTSLSKLLGTSTNSMVKRVYAFATGTGDTGGSGGGGDQPAENDFKARLAMFKKIEEKPSGPAPRLGGRKSGSFYEAGQEVVKRASITVRFSRELRELVERINKTEVQYVLCIRPNMQNDPVVFDSQYVTGQLLSASIVEAGQVYKFIGVNVAKEAFVQRFKVLASRELVERVRSSPREQSADFADPMAAELLPPDGKEALYQSGMTQLFIKGQAYEWLEEVSAMHELVISRKILRMLKKNVAAKRKAEKEAARKARQLAREEAAQEGRPEPLEVLDVDSKSRAYSDDQSDAAPVSPLQTSGPDGAMPETAGSEAGGPMQAARLEPFTKETMRAFLNQPAVANGGVIECIIKRKKGVMNTIYQVFYQPSMKLLMTAKKDRGRYIITMNPEFLRQGEPSTLGKVKAVAQRRQYIVYDNGFIINKTMPEKYTINPERKEIAAVSIDLTRHDDFQGPRKLEVLVADADEELVDHASLLNSFGNDNTEIITPVPRMHSIKPEWDEDAGYFVLEFYKDRIKKQSVKNFMLHNSRGQFIMQFGRSKEDNVFALDFTHPFSPLGAFGVALANCDCNV